MQGGRWETLRCCVLWQRWGKRVRQPILCRECDREVDER